MSGWATGLTGFSGKSLTTGGFGGGGPAGPTACKYTTYDGVGDYQHINGGFITAGSTVTTVSVALWLRVQAGWSTSALVGESGSTADFGWMFYIADTGQLLFMASDDTTGKQWTSATGQLTADTWTHLAAVYNAGTVTVYKNGSTVAQATNTTAASITRRSEFAIGADNTDGTPALVATVDLSRIVVEEAAWNAATVTAILNNTARPSAAWYFPNGDGVETAQGLTALTTAGDPVTTVTDCSDFSIAPAAPATTRIFSFVNGSIGSAAWNSYRSSLDTGSEGRPVGDLTTKHTFGSYSLSAPVNHEVAELVSNKLVHHRYTVPQDKHNLLAAWASGASAEDFYLKKEIAFRVYLTFTLGGRTEADWRDQTKLGGSSGFAVLWESWQPMNWPGWTGGGQAPIQLIVDQVGGTGDAKLLFRIRGSTNGTSFTATDEVTLATTLVATHEVEIRYELNINTGTAWSVYHGGTEQGSGTQEIGVDLSPGGSYAAGSASPQIGLYTSSGAEAGYKATFSRYEIDTDP